MKPLRDRIVLRCPIDEVRRVGERVRVQPRGREARDYDHVVLACHADQSLQILVDADSAEQEILEGFPYQANTAILHTDETVLPRKRRAWASWNYHIPEHSTNQVSVTYDLNRLQSLGLPGPLCLTLNPNCEINPDRVLKRFEFAHPVFSLASIDSQRRFHEVNAIRRISFCGAYWGYGFHEDGVRSALAVARHFGLGLEDLARPVRTTTRAMPAMVGASGSPGGEGDSAYAAAPSRLSRYESRID